ncbi:hypothetical protein VKT23_006150 [Stygiomarasmius scandens]|uniref:Uncharacterized protein n=1 Tax=Marasmiellus scandens TaxID=2682957 RepID=A0ABR1JSP0_9AGAR
MLIFSTISLVLEIEFYITQLPLFSFNLPDPDKIIKLLTNQQISLLFMERMNYPISDGIVVWRAWILFPDHFLVRSVLAFLFFGSCVGIFVDAGLATASLLGDLSNNGPNTRALIIATPTIMTNAVATALIAWKAWSVLLPTR